MQLIDVVRFERLEKYPLSDSPKSDWRPQELLKKADELVASDQILAEVRQTASDKLLKLKVDPNKTDLVAAAIVVQIRPVIQLGVNFEVKEHRPMIELGGVTGHKFDVSYVDPTKPPRKGIERPEQKIMILYPEKGIGEQTP